eukprot:TRINITY_DN3656_c0_g1_i3.p1 TRINITY_DN3656_c0_g1~~TRINITY_DN3656_c0_g1_i3.p1  ORF type:complete len:101 (+),score=12.28 TRINITY_DN3656_c0_g1_i3:64-366(+)
MVFPCVGRLSFLALMDITKHLYLQSRKLVNDIGDMMSVQVIVEGSMNSSNPYFSSSWRRGFTVSDMFDGTNAPPPLSPLSKLFLWALLMPRSLISVKRIN